MIGFPEKLTGAAAHAGAVSDNSTPVQQASQCARIGASPAAVGKSPAAPVDPVLKQPNRIAAAIANDRRFTEEESCCPRAWHRRGWALRREGGKRREGKEQ